MSNYVASGREVVATLTWSKTADAEIDVILQTLESDTLAVRELMSVEIAANVISPVKLQVVVDWKNLQAIVERHESTLRKRWTKKPVAKRQELLLHVWPHMPQTHRPDFAHWEVANHPGLRLPARRNPGGLWPYINLEDLTDRKSLLLYINSRARQHPDTFAFTEMDHAMAVRVLPQL
jgi:hypothetical protein